MQFKIILAKSRVGDTKIRIDLFPKSFGLSFVFFAKPIAGVRYYIQGLYIHVEKSIYNFVTIMASPFKFDTYAWQETCEKCCFFNSGSVMK